MQMRVFFNVSQHSDLFTSLPIKAFRIQRDVSLGGGVMRSVYEWSQVRRVVHFKLLRLFLLVVESYSLYGLDQIGCHLV